MLSSRGQSEGAQGHGSGGGGWRKEGGARAMQARAEEGAKATRKKGHGHENRGRRGAQGARTKGASAGRGRRGEDEAREQLKQLLDARNKEVDDRSLRRMEPARTEFYVEQAEKSNNNLPSARASGRVPNSTALSSGAFNLSNAPKDFLTARPSADRMSVISARSSTRSVGARGQLPPSSSGPANTVGEFVNKPVGNVARRIAMMMSKGEADKDRQGYKHKKGSTRDPMGGPARLSGSTRDPMGGSARVSGTGIPTPRASGTRSQALLESAGQSYPDEGSFYGPTGTHYSPPPVPSMYQRTAASLAAPRPPNNVNMNRQALGEGAEDTEMSINMASLRKTMRLYSVEIADLLGQVVSPDQEPMAVRQVKRRGVQQRQAGTDTTDDSSDEDDESTDEDDGSTDESDVGSSSNDESTSGSDSEDDSTDESDHDTSDRVSHTNRLPAATSPSPAPASSAVGVMSRMSNAVQSVRQYFNPAYESAEGEEDGEGQDGSTDAPQLKKAKSKKLAKSLSAHPYLALEEEEKKKKKKKKKKDDGEEEMDDDGTVKKKKKKKGDEAAGDGDGDGAETVKEDGNRVMRAYASVKKKKKKKKDAVAAEADTEDIPEGDDDDEEEEEDIAEAGALTGEAAVKKKKKKKKEKQAEDEADVEEEDSLDPSASMKKKRKKKKNKDAAVVAVALQFLPPIALSNSKTRDLDADVSELHLRRPRGCPVSPPDAKKTTRKDEPGRPLRG
eukprot:gene17844-24230_t